ncbi:MAG: hypothetical protein RL297_370 [Pseudomonadota bacterium]|jgi:hypothetical protein
MNLKLGLGYGVLLLSCVALMSCGGGGTGSTPPALVADEMTIEDFKPIPVTPQTCVPGTWSANTAHTMEGKTLQYQTEHFAFSWAGQDLTQADAEIFGNNLEAIWSLYRDKVGWPEPYCDTADKKKVNVFMDPNWGLTGGGRGDRDPAFWVNTRSGTDTWGLAHEFAHALQFHTMGMRWTSTGGWFWESHAQYMARQFHPEVLHCGDSLVNSPHVYYGSTRNRYCNFQFWEFLKNKLGYGVMNDVWTKALAWDQPGRDIEEPLGVLMRNLNLDARGLGDLFGEWAMRNATWDYPSPDGADHGELMRKNWGTNDRVNYNESWSARRTSGLVLQADGSFAIPNYWAPQRYGYNMVRLRPEAGATSFRIDFKGQIQTQALHQLDLKFANQMSLFSTPDSDWRWGVVALGGDDKPRYSKLQRGAQGSLNFDIKPDDKAVWMVVVATPTSLHKAIWDQGYNTFFRYPWSIKATGVKPDGHQPDAPKPTDCGQAHTNGGGWVACGATVASTVYVGPNAVVLSGNLSGQARVEDHAVVRNSTMSGRARVGALTYLDKSTMGDDAYLASTFPGNVIEGRTLTGSVVLLGDLEVWPVELSKGVFMGIVDNNMPSNPAYGSERRHLPLDLTVGGYSGPHLVQSDTDLCLAAEASDENTGLLHMATCAPETGLQSWAVTDLFPAAPVVKISGADFCIQTGNDELAAGTPVHLWPCSDQNQGQQWRYGEFSTQGRIQSVFNPAMCLVTKDQQVQVGLCSSNGSNGTANVLQLNYREL